MKTQNEEITFQETLALLRRLIAIPSFSGEEERSADVLEEFFRQHGLRTYRKKNNIVVRTSHSDARKPVVLLNSHHDTVRPVHGWSVDPFTPILESEKVIGLGSNDACGALCTMANVFIVLSQRSDLPFNLIFAATAEEETAGQNGIELILHDFDRIDMAIVGEPTGMEMAVAERGLLVLDCTAHGVSSHAARDIGTNAIEQAMHDISWFHSYKFPVNSDTLGQMKMTVTQIHAGTQHNVIPDRCTFVVDIRVTDKYTHEEILETIRDHVLSDVQPRSVRLRPSSIDSSHPLVRAAKHLGVRRYGSPTMSDQSLMTFPSVKIGPGLSERSHTANEFILLSELRNGITGYIALLKQLAVELTNETLE